MMNNKNTSSIGLNKQDYVLATSCGVVTGLIDAIFVGNPKDSKLLKKTDKLADTFVVNSAQFFWRHDKRKTGKYKEMPADLDTGISYLEHAFPIAQELKVAQVVLNQMTPINQYISSWAHSPDLIGLVFSIIDQFINPTSFVDDEKVIQVLTKNESQNSFPYLYGSDNQTKIFCGFINWMGFMASDIAGSSPTHKPENGSRGSGIVTPFFSLSQALVMREFDGDKFAELMTQVYEEGYDHRFGIAAAIPVLINDLLTKTVWIMRQRFIKKKGWKESLPSAKDGDFRLFLLVSNTSFELVDCADAAIHAAKIKSGLKMNWVDFFIYLNFVGIARLSGLVLRECMIRVGSPFVEDSDALVQSVSELIPDNADNDLSETISAYFECLDFKKALSESMQEYKEAKEKRIEIEKKVKENIENIIRYREKMLLQVESYFEDYLVSFDEGIDRIDQGIVSNDSDMLIEGNSIIQKKFDWEPQFESQEDFNNLMESDDDFVF